MSITKWLNNHLPKSIYLGFLEACLGRLYNWSPAHRINERVKRTLGTKLSPRWVSELYQLASVASAVALLFLAPNNPEWALFPIAAYCIWRLIEIFVFALHWVFVARDPVESFRRSLFAFLVNVLEVALFTSILMVISQCAERGASRGELLYRNLASIFSFSVLNDFGTGVACWLLPRAELTIGWVLLLIALTVVISGITRREHGTA